MKSTTRTAYQHNSLPNLYRLFQMNMIVLCKSSIYIYTINKNTLGSNLHKKQAQLSRFDDFIKWKMIAFLYYRKKVQPLSFMEL